MSSIWWLLAIFFAVVAGSVTAVGAVMLRRWAGPAAGAGAAGGDLLLAAGPEPGLKARLARTLHALGEALPVPRGGSEPLRQRLLMAGYRWPSAVTVFQGIKAATALGMAGATGWTILFLRGGAGDALVPCLAAAGFGYLLPDRWLDRAIRARARRLRTALPPAVDLMVLAVEAGQGLDQAMLDVAQALAPLHPELSDEFAFAHLEVRAGKNREEALRGLMERSPESELKKFVTVLLDGDRFGTSLGPALRTHVHYLRTRLRQQAQERARKLGVKLTIPIFFFIFPAVLAVTLGPAYLLLRDSLQQLLNAF